MSNPISWLRPRARLANLLLVLAGLWLALGASAQVPDTPFQTMANPGAPLTRIFVGNDLSLQVEHASDPGIYQIYPSGAKPGDYGTLAVIDGVLYAPDFTHHSGGTATGIPLGVHTPFTPVSQTAPAGAGTPNDPQRVVTVADAGASGIRITQTDSYVLGQEIIRTDMRLHNSGSQPKNVLLYRAMDCYLGADDRGFGAASGGTVSCTKTPNNTPPDRVLSLIPLSAGSSYLQDGYADVWRHIASQTPFPNACNSCTNNFDNGIGLSWSITVPAGGSVSLANLTLFSPTGRLPLPTAKTASPSSVAAGGQVSYTITVTNPNSSAVTLNTLTDTLPAGFSYVPGSASGATTANPVVAGQALSWNGPLTVPGNNGTLSLSFSAQVAASVAPGTYHNRVQGTAAGGHTVLDSGDTAPVTVTAAAGVQPLSTAVSVTPAALLAGAQAHYSISIHNPNAAQVPLSALRATLPAGFSYVPGSSSGATSADPAVAGQNLDWAGPLAVPARGTLVLRFAASVGAGVAAGTYPISVQPTPPAGYSAPAATAVAPVQVLPSTGVPATPGLTAVPTLSGWGLMALAATLAGMSAARMRRR